MYKIYILSLLLILLICCENNNDIYYKWDLIEYEYKKNNNEEQEVILRVQYEIRNNANKEIWFYNMQRGNDNQYVEFETKGNIIKRIFYIIKPYEKSNNGWYGSAGYNPVYPTALPLHSDETIRGEMNIKYVIDNNIDPKYMIYQFNFIILDIDIEKNFIKLNIDEINNKYSKNYFVEIKIPDEMNKIRQKP